MIREAPALPPIALADDPSTPATNNEPELDVSNVQGNILAGFNKDFQTLLLLQIRDASSAREWLKRLIPYIATTSEVLAFNRLFKEIRRRRGSESRAVQSTWINVALSFKALEALAKAAGDLSQAASQFRTFANSPKEAFSIDLFEDGAFREGLSARAVSKLNDPETGEGSPQQWVFGGPDNEADIVVIVASDDRDDLDDEVARIENTVYSGRTLDGAAASGVAIIYKQQGATLPPPLTGHEHFGFLDGVSQPGIRGRVSSDPRDVLTRRQNPSNPNHGKPGQQLVWPGEFVFGYPGQIGDPEEKDFNKPGADSLGEGTNAAGPVWARDGSYFVVRRLRQDVPLFHQFLNDAAKQAGTTPEHLGAKLVGRWKSGAPVMRAPDQDNTRLAFDDCANNHFRFQEASVAIDSAKTPHTCKTESPFCSDKEHAPSPGDPTGDLCPFGAHKRKTYPRDDKGDLAPQIGETTTQTHRLLRRGIPYGAPYIEPKDPDRQRDEGDRGLVFAAYQTSIEGQFEFVQAAWANNPDFKDRPTTNGELKSGFDLIIGQAAGDRRRSCPVRLNGKTHVITAEQDFVIPTGGGYFFAPSLDALCLLTGSEPERGREAAN